MILLTQKLEGIKITNILSSDQILHILRLYWMSEITQVWNKRGNSRDIDRVFVLHKWCIRNTFSMSFKETFI